MVASLLEEAGKEKAPTVLAWENTEGGTYRQVECSTVPVGFYWRPTHTRSPLFLSLVTRSRRCGGQLPARLYVGTHLQFPCSGARIRGEEVVLGSLATKIYREILITKK